MKLVISVTNAFQKAVLTQYMANRVSLPPFHCLYRIFLSSLLLCNTSSFFKRSIQLIFIPLQNSVSKNTTFYPRNQNNLRCFCVLSHPVYFLKFVDPCILKKNPTRCNNVSNFIIPCLYGPQHVSGDTPPIIRSTKLHWQPLVLHTWKVVGRIVVKR